MLSPSLDRVVAARKTVHRLCRCPSIPCMSLLTCAAQRGHLPPIALAIFEILTRFSLLPLETYSSRICETRQPDFHVL